MINLLSSGQAVTAGYEMDSFGLNQSRPITPMNNPSHWPIYQQGLMASENVSLLTPSHHPNLLFIIYHTTAPPRSFVCCSSSLVFLDQEVDPSLLPCCMVVDDGTIILLLLPLGPFSIDRAC